MVFDRPLLLDMGCALQLCSLLTCVLVCVCVCVCVCVLPQASQGKKVGTVVVESLGRWDTMHS